MRLGFWLSGALVCEASGFKVEGLGFKAWSLGQGSNGKNVGFSVQRLRFRVQGLGFSFGLHIAKACVLTNIPVPDSLQNYGMGRVK